MQSDPGKIKQILYNLLSNAVKFTPEEGTIALRIERCDEARVQMIVSDTGPGIDDDLQEKIFEKFSQLDSSETREHAGTGLGLAITRELVTMLGGTIKLQSSLGHGSTFTVELPRTFAPPSASLPASTVLPPRTGQP
jgi:signal transduction histidine kinase